VEVKHTESDISWGVNDPSTSDTDGYLIEIYYRQREDEDIILQEHYQIINIESDNITINPEYLD
jgi:hypothetical protein